MICLTLDFGLLTAWPRGGCGMGGLGDQRRTDLPTPRSGRERICRRSVSATNGQACRAVADETLRTALQWAMK